MQLEIEERLLSLYATLPMLTYAKHARWKGTLFPVLESIASGAMAIRITYNCNVLRIAVQSFKSDQIIPMSLDRKCFLQLQKLHSCNCFILNAIVSHFYDILHPWNLINTIVMFASLFEKYNNYSIIRKFLFYTLISILKYDAFEATAMECTGK